MKLLTEVLDGSMKTVARIIDFPSEEDDPNILCDFIHSLPDTQLIPKSDSS